MLKNFLKIFDSFKQHKYLDIIDDSNEKEKPILIVKNLTKKYFGRKKPAIDNICFNVYPGQFHAFIGANGAGKTTTIKSIIGAYQNWSGTILINGIRNDNEEAKKIVGYIPEYARFPDNLNTYSYLKWMITLSGISEAKALKITKEKLVELNMWNLRNKSPNSFSSGQKKKILLAQALIHNPKLIIMDEPVANLDPKARLEFFNTLKEVKKLGVTVFISSHVLAELEIYFDSLTILDGGKIVFSGTKEKLYEKFNDCRYSINTSNNKLLLTFLKNNKYEIKGANNNMINVIANNKQGLLKIQNFINNHKLKIEHFNKNQPSLNEIYDELVVKGSVDTMKS